MACVGGLRDALVLQAKVAAPAGALVEKLATRAYAPSVRLLRLRGLVARLGTAADELQGVLSREDAGRVTWEAVTAADDAGFAAMGELVARVLGAFPTDRPAHIDARLKLLVPIFRGGGQAPRAAPAAEVGARGAEGGGRTGRGRRGWIATPRRRRPAWPRPSPDRARCSDLEHERVYCGLVRRASSARKSWRSIVSSSRGSPSPVSALTGKPP